MIGFAKMAPLKIVIGDWFSVIGKSRFHLLVAGPRLILSCRREGGALWATSEETPPRFYPLLVSFGVAQPCSNCLCDDYSRTYAEDGIQSTDFTDDPKGSTDLLIGT
jgi:hypothetical protein